MLTFSREVLLLCQILKSMLSLFLFEDGNTTEDKQILSYSQTKGKVTATTFFTCVKKMTRYHFNIIVDIFMNGQGQKFPSLSDNFDHLISWIRRKWQKSKISAMKTMYPKTTTWHQRWEYNERKGIYNRLIVGGTQRSMLWSWTKSWWVTLRFYTRCTHTTH